MKGNPDYGSLQRTFLTLAWLLATLVTPASAALAGRVSLEWIAITVYLAPLLSLAFSALALVTLNPAPHPRMEAAGRFLLWLAPASFAGGVVVSIVAFAVSRREILFVDAVLAAWILSSAMVIGRCRSAVLPAAYRVGVLVASAGLGGVVGLAAGGPLHGAVSALFCLFMLALPSAVYPTRVLNEQSRESANGGTHS